MNSKQQILLNKIEYLFKFFYVVGILVVLAVLSEVGKNYIISSFMVFMLIYLFGGLCLPQGFANVVKARFQKQQFKNAKAVFQGTLIYIFILEMILIVSASLFVNRLSEFLHVDKALPHGIGLFIPLLLLVPVNEVFRVYYQCYNRRLTIVISRALGFLTALIVGICIYNPLRTYGMKVDSLLKSDCMTDIYASLTIPIAILASQAMVLLYLAWMYLVYKPYIRKQTVNDFTRYKESLKDVFGLIARAHTEANIHKISIYLLIFMAFIFCSFYTRQGIAATKTNTSFGILAIVMCVTILVPYFITKAFTLKYVLRYRKMLKNEDMRSVRSYLWGRTHKYFIITFALAVFFIVMSESVIFIMTGTVAPQYVLHMQILSISIVLVPLYGLYHMFLTNIGKTKSLVIINYSALFVSGVIMTILYNVHAIGGYGISVGVVCYFLIAFLCEYFVLQRESGFGRNIMQLLVLPLLCAFIMGIIALLLINVIGISEFRVAQFFIVLGLLVLCIFIYMILLLVLRCVDEDELNGGFWGKIIYKLGEILHVY